MAKGSLSPNHDLIKRMDSMCEHLVREVLGEIAGDDGDKIKYDLRDKLATFGHVTRWVAVRHKIEGLAEDDSDTIESLKQRLKSAADRRAASNARIAATAERILSGTQLGPTHQSADLDRIKRSVPSFVAGDDDGDIPDSSSEIYFTAGGTGGVGPHGDGDA